jgi:hypothetical protein
MTDLMTCGWRWSTGWPMACGAVPPGGRCCLHPGGDAHHHLLRSRSSCTARRRTVRWNFIPMPSHFFRFWLWLTTGMVTKEFVAVHRKHHAKCETADDPHSPQTRGIKARCC